MVISVFAGYLDTDEQRRHDLEHLQHFKLMQAGFCCKLGGPMTHCNCLDLHAYPHSIWGLSFIDKRAFRIISGYAPDQMNDRKYEEHWNGSIMRLCVPDASSTYRLKRARPGYLRGHDQSSPANSEDDEDADDEDEWEHGYSTTYTMPPTTTHLTSSLHAMSHPWYANLQPVGSRSIMGQS